MNVLNVFLIHSIYYIFSFVEINEVDGELANWREAGLESLALSRSLSLSHSVPSLYLEKLNGHAIFVDDLKKDMILVLSNIILGSW